MKFLAPASLLLLTALTPPAAVAEDHSYLVYVGDSNVKRPANDLQCDQAFERLDEATQGERDDQAASEGSNVQDACRRAIADYAELLQQLPPAHLVLPLRRVDYGDPAKWGGLDSMWVRAYRDMCGFQVAYALGKQSTDGMSIATTSWNDLQNILLEFSAVTAKASGIDPHARATSETQHRVESAVTTFPSSVTDLWQTVQMISALFANEFPGLVS